VSSGNFKHELFAQLARVGKALIERCAGDCDPDKEVVGYCRGPWRVLADDAVARLRENGRKARRLEGGLPEWRQAGLHLEQER
jgi:ArsR family transcriptional regulator